MEILTALLLVIIIALIALLLRKVDSLAAKLEALERPADSKQKIDTATPEADKPDPGNIRPPLE